MRQARYDNLLTVPQLKTIDCLIVSTNGRRANVSRPTTFEPARVTQLQICNDLHRSAVFKPLRSQAMGYSTCFAGSFNFKGSRLMSRAQWLYLHLLSRKPGGPLNCQALQNREDPLRIEVGLPLGVDGAFYVNSAYFFELLGQNKASSALEAYETQSWPLQSSYDAQEELQGANSSTEKEGASACLPLPLGTNKRPVRDWSGTHMVRDFMTMLIG